MIIQSRKVEITQATLRSLRGGEGNLEMDRLWNEYYSALDARARNAMFTARQQDQRTWQSMNSMNQPTTQNQNTIEHTNCTVFGNTMNCTTH